MIIKMIIMLVIFMVIKIGLIMIMMKKTKEYKLLL